MQKRVRQKAEWCYEKDHQKQCSEEQICEPVVKRESPSWRLRGGAEQVFIVTKRVSAMTAKVNDTKTMCGNAWD